MTIDNIIVFIQVFQANSDIIGNIYILTKN